MSDTWREPIYGEPDGETYDLSPDHRWKMRRFQASTTAIRFCFRRIVVDRWTFQLMVPMSRYWDAIPMTERDNRWWEGRERSEDWDMEDWQSLFGDSPDEDAQCED
jgi:hypothetical protein